MSNNSLFCPIRGQLKILKKSKDELNYTEEFRRIECVNFLLDKGYPKENFDFEKNILKYGSSGRNTLRADIIIYNKSKKEIEKNERVKNIFLVAEIKRNSEEKDSALRNQLIPALNHSQNSKYGIYWDNENKILLNKNDLNKQYNILKLPFFNSKWEDKPLKFNDLKRIKNSKSILKLLEQSFHNLGGTDKAFRYKEIYKILIIKYFDETKNKNTDFLEFQILGEEENKKEELFKRIEKLYKEAKSYYSNNSPLILGNELKVSPAILLKSLKILEEFSFIKTNQLILQNFFVSFAPVVLKIALDQYFTPLEVVEFMTSVIELKETDCAIDPAGGSADFLTGLIKKGLNQGIENIKENIFYWDISKDAGNVASLNMILQGDGRSNIEILDSIENYNKSNDFFQLCLTNPPFGKETKWEKDLSIMENYELGKKYSDNKKNYELVKQQLGILFIERNMNILKEGGVLEIIVPNGFLTNPSLKYIREYLFNNFRIIANISLPFNLFKSSGAGGNTNILIVKKEKTEKDYKIFLEVVRNVGYEYDKKKNKPIYRRDKNTGELLKDKENNLLLDNELLTTEKKFKKFIFDEKIQGFESENNNKVYDFVNKEKVTKDKNLILCPKRFSSEYKKIKNKIGKNDNTTLNEINAEVQNSISFRKKLSKEYIYLDTGEVFTGGYKKNNILKSWELPNRAKQSLKKYDILVAKLRGSIGKFCIILEDNENFVASNGFWRIRIENEKERLNFYSYLFTKEFEKQMEALSTGTIMDDVKDFDMKNNLLIPTNNKEENYKKIKKLIEIQETLIISS